ncbi:MAG: winged helix-turn-helix domain-containing protein [Aigarchaeota archaeon]|nr:winged helix-turn-helix domain-containing protein [Aigarchaeota archaeon]
MQLGTRRNRTRMEIVADILQVAVPGARKTHIMYGANLSFEQLEKYLKFLLRRGLLGNEAGKGEYKTTKTGTSYLREFKEYHKYQETFEEKKQLLEQILEGYEAG